MLRAIGAMCPKLKEVAFMYYVGSIDFEVTKSILSGWPKVSYVNYSPSFIERLLTIMILAPKY